jgi:hypothetical protein
MKVSPGADLFLNIRLTPSANLSRLEEVLVITKKEDRAPAVAEIGSRVRAVDILTQRLPSVPDKPVVEPVGSTAANPPAGGSVAGLKPGKTGSVAPAAGTPAAAKPGVGNPRGNSETRAAVKPATVERPAAAAKKVSEPMVKPAASPPAPPPPGKAKPAAEDQPH